MPAFIPTSYMELIDLILRNDVYISQDGMTYTSNLNGIEYTLKCIDFHGLVVLASISKGGDEIWNLKSSMIKH